MDSVRSSGNRRRRPASERGGRKQSAARLRVVGSDGAQEAGHDVDERLSSAVADLRWRLHDIDALRWRRNLIARGAAPLIAMPRGYEHIAQVLNSKRRLDERIAEVIRGVAKPLLGVVGAAGAAALLATSPLLNARLVQGFELAGSPAEAALPVVATIPEQQARWLGPPIVVVGAPVVAAGAERIGPWASSLNPFSGRAHGTFWSSRVMGTTPAGEAAPTTPPAAPAPAAPAPVATGAQAKPAAGVQPAPSTVPAPPPPAATPAPTSSVTPTAPGASTGAQTPVPSSTPTSTASPTTPTPTATAPTTTSGTPGSGTTSSTGTPTTSTAPTSTTAPTGTTTTAPTTGTVAPAP